MKKIIEEVSRDKMNTEKNKKNTGVWNMNKKKNERESDPQKRKKR